MDASGQLGGTDGGPGLTFAEQLTRQFYDWERQGRGWVVWDQPVELEPPFRPFYFYLPQPEAPFDDGKRETFLSRWANKLTGRRDNAASRAELPLAPELLLPYVQEPFPVAEIQVSLPPECGITKNMAEHLLLNLAYCRGMISFEVIGTAEAIVVQFACREADAQQVCAQLKAHYPEALLCDEYDYLERHWKNRPQAESLVVDFALSSEFMRPLRTSHNFDSDPLVGIIGALDHLDPGEVGVLQVLFQPVENPWAESIVHSVTDGRGRSFFVDAPEMTTLAREKLAHPLYAVVLRIAALSPLPGRAWDIVRHLGGGLAQYNDPSSNELIPLNNDHYPHRYHERDLLWRQSCRSGMILNSNELVCLSHLPAPSVRAARLVRAINRSKAAPPSVTEGEVLLGHNTHNGSTLPVMLRADQRVKHIYTVGASGTGKSTFLLNLISQDIEQGRGVALLDPHGDLVDDVLTRIPEHRHQDVILFDPADGGYPIGFNVLSAHSELEKNLIASDMVAVFQRLSTSWGDQMTTVFSNAILAFLESDRGGTLSDLRRFLVEKDYRREFLKTVRDRDIVYYWEKEFPLLSGRPQGPILTRLDYFLRPKLIRHMVAQRENRLDFADIMNSGKIFLARLSQGAIGEENAHLLGTLLVAKFHQLTLSRQEIQEEQRRPFYLYIDEFHNFITPSMASILTGVRKYRLGLVLAHQELRQLEKRDAEVASAALSNPYTRVCFRVGEADARKLAEGLSFFEPADLLNLRTGEAICRLERADRDFNLRVPLPSSIRKEAAAQRRERITALSRRRYGTPVAEVEAYLEARWQPVKTDDATQVPAVEESIQRTPAVPSAPVPQAPAAEPAIPATKPTRSARRASPAPPLMGKGGQEHKYLQQFIKRWAEGMGYRATIEKTLDGGASVDVALEKGDVSIACEIAVSTSPEHELDNLKKCLVAGFGNVITVSTDPAKLASVQRQVAEALSPEESQRVSFKSPEELFLFIEEIEADAASREHTVRGYKVKVKYGAASGQEKQARKRAVSQVLLGALSKAKRKK
ncbi:MAG: ATP-binding protein [Candidatus Hydrogenedentes bacterium]|nr:ATP-binding protein [Candidatus Hydrogenedentota bacterium]